MTVVVHPDIPLASVADRAKFLSLVRDVAHETQANEPDCLAYCWTHNNSVDGAAISVQGLEVYKSQEALAVTHRSSMPYKHMREVIATTGLITYPKGGVPSYSAIGNGFLWKEGVAHTVHSNDYFLFIHYSVKDQESIDEFVQEERLFSHEMNSIDSVLALWCFISDLPEEEVPITLFLRLPGVGAYEELIEGKICQFERKVLYHDKIKRTGIYKGKGFGFFRR